VTSRSERGWRSARPSASGRCRNDRGQSTVELAIALPVIVIGLLCVVQVALVVIDQVRVVHAAREGARRASVRSGDVASVASIASGLPPARLNVTVRNNGDTATVTARYRSPTDVPLVGAFLDDVTVSATAAMMLEPEPAPAWPDSG
jgi:Flp pilus assembly protein TadG